MGSHSPHDPDLRESHAATVLTLDRVVITACVAASVLLLLRLVHSSRRLRQQRRLWNPTEIDGVPVLVSERVGPAIIGLTRPTIVIPRWLLQMPSESQRIVLWHEREHLAAGDAITLFAARCLTIAVLWNVFMHAASSSLAKEPTASTTGRTVASEPRIVITGSTAPSSLRSDSTFFEFQVQKPVATLQGGAFPRFPDSLRVAGVEGEVLAQFVVDGEGRPDTASFRVLKATRAGIRRRGSHRAPRDAFLTGDQGWPRGETARAAALQLCDREVAA